ncbi:hypothetical protein [Haloquadratum walsbyi]|jgi:hypothetical protein|uniref:Uncharacterized protein n=1 Tax=Haloquadratum walsbyi J07HQW2 TaxID=1238425 RepID=U1MV50_9EURY|nr:hypothetical protein [Haloquadratum walsbyi]ERG94284.1 MAG: hypothetical protein J07HQW2_00718 [Haloquadratum walsbyi J07HQW2]
MDKLLRILKQLQSMVDDLDKDNFTFDAETTISNLSDGDLLRSHEAHAAQQNAEEADNLAPVTNLEGMTSTLKEKSSGSTG